MKNRLVIVGCGELGKQVMHQAEISDEFFIVGFLDDYVPPGSLIMDKPVLGDLSQISDLYNHELFDSIFIAIGYAHLDFKKSLYGKVKKCGIPLATIVNKASYIDPSATIGQGVIIYPGCVIDKNAVINDNVLINTGALIAHDSIIGKHSFISGRTAVAGFSSIGECCFTGINSTIIDNLNIPDNSLIPAGSVVITSTICQVGKPIRINLINNQYEE